ncbi:MAG: 5-methyltetrahydropteroyltriglutamate--homocysteine S-methyltransferase, partial [Planctomycetota bacterium]|nr:5-methyltetrahydropteroyltriglutamate--homocysteine S-methyltransferase [Planctomycetota bacterium]
QQGIRELEQSRIAAYAQFVDAYPVGELTLYDNMLDTAIMLGVYPIDPADLNAYFELARGADALPMTKWFNTNYHYLVSRLSPETEFRLHWNKPLQAYQANLSGYPYLIGPYTFLRLSRGLEPEQLPALLEKLTPVYAEILQSLKAAGAAYVHIDEPAFALDVPDADVRAIRAAY